MGLVIMRKYDHIDTWSLRSDGREYRFLFPVSPDMGNEITVRDRARVAAATREWINDLPPYKGTFCVTQIVKNIDVELESNDEELSAANVREPMLLLSDSWRAPDYLPTGEQNGNRWVNPNYEHLREYMAGSAECECGQVITKMHNSGGNARFGDVRHHNEDCLPEWRADMVRRLIEERRRIFLLQGLLAKSARSLADRLYTNEDDVIHYYRSAFDIDYGEIRDLGREKRNKTVVRLINEGVDVEVIATLFGFTKGTARRIVSQHSPYDIRDLRTDDMAFGDDNEVRVA